MFYVYVLKSEKDGSIYIGYSNDLKRRLVEHNRAHSQSTKSKRPWILIYYEAYRSQRDAKYREGNLKDFAKAYGQLKCRIIYSLGIEAEKVRGR